MSNPGLRSAVFVVALLLVACGEDEPPAEPVGSPPSIDAAGTVQAPTTGPLGPGATSERALSATFERVRPVVEEILGQRFEDPVRFIPVTTDRITDLVTRETVALLKGMEGQEQTPEAMAVVEATAKRQSKLLAQALLAKIDIATGEILVHSGTFTRVAAAAPEFAGVNTQGFLDLVVAHESVHVFQHRAFDLGAFVADSGSMEKLNCRSCVLEGHAQYVTKRVAERLGLETEFELFRTVNSKVPESVEDPFVKMMAEVLNSTLGLAYLQGHEFFEAVAAAWGYPKAVERLFAAPPEQLRSVTHPDEYLAGDKPASHIQEILRQGRALFDEQQYTITTTGVQSVTLRSLLSMADPEAIERAVEDFVEGAAIIAAPKHGDAGGQKILAIMVQNSEEASERFMALERVVTDWKDETFGKPGGTIHIRSADYEELEYEGKPGFSADKAARIGGRDLQVRAVVLQRGPYVAELSAVGGEEDMASLRAIVERVLEIAHTISR